MVDIELFADMVFKIYVTRISFVTILFRMMVERFRRVVYKLIFQD